MHRKYCIMILVSHLSLVVSMFFPVLTVSEIRLAPWGAGDQQEQSLNIIDYMNKAISPITGYFMIFLLIVAILGIGNAVFGIARKNVNSLSVKLAFIFGFSSAAMAALQIYSGSVLLLLISVATFVVISFASVKLIKMDEVENAQKF